MNKKNFRYKTNFSLYLPAEMVEVIETQAEQWFCSSNQVMVRVFFWKFLPEETEVPLRPPHRKSGNLCDVDGNHGMATPPRPIDTDEKLSRSIYMPVALHKVMCERAKERGCSLNKLALEVLLEYFLSGVVCPLVSTQGVGVSS